MSNAEKSAVEDLIAEGRALAPWHLAVDVTADVSTRDFAHDAYPESFGPIRLIDPRERFTDTLRKLYPDGLGGRSVLDCACNCGGFLFWARDMGAGQCHGIDVREHWIEQARFLAANRSAASDEMEFEALDLYGLPERGLEPFDVVLFNGIFYHLPDPVEGLRIAAGLARELLIINTSSTVGLPDGQLAVSGESLTRAISGVYGLNWFPTGPKVLTRLLGWVGMTEVRVNWWSRLPGQRPRNARLEVVAARDPSVLAAFDAAERELPPLTRLVEKTVPPEATVLVADAADGASVKFDQRPTLPFPPSNADAGEAELIAELVRLRGEGADYLLLTPQAAPWLAANPGFQGHVHKNFKRVAREQDVGVLFSLQDGWRTK
jgi:tRNA (mo5U34)-methyltransferase